MFCRLGSVRGQPAGGGDGLLVRRVDPAVVGDRLQQPLDGLTRSRVASRCRSRCIEERVLGLGVQVGERVGVGGVAGLGPLGLGHAELVEQHHLQLLGRAEVDLLAADRVVGVLLAPRATAAAKCGLEVGQRRRRRPRCRPAPSGPARRPAAARRRRAAPAPPVRSSSRVERARTGRGRRGPAPSPARPSASSVGARSRARPDRRCRRSAAQLAAAGGAAPGRPGRSCAGRAGTGRRPAPCRW